MFFQKGIHSRVHTDCLSFATISFIHFVLHVVVAHGAPKSFVVSCFFFRFCLMKFSFSLNGFFSVPCLLLHSTLSKHSQMKWKKSENERATKRKEKNDGETVPRSLELTVKCFKWSPVTFSLWRCVIVGVLRPGNIHPNFSSQSVCVCWCGAAATTFYLLFAFAFVLWEIYLFLFSVLSYSLSFLLFLFLFFILLFLLFLSCWARCEKECVHACGCALSSDFFSRFI